MTLAPAGAAQSEVPFAEVYAAPRDPGPDASWLARRPVELPYWSGNVDLSLSTTESTKDTSALAVGLGLRRERGPSRLEFDASYRRGTTQNDFAKRDPVTGVKDDGQEITADQLRGFLRQEYDLTSRIFALGSFEAEHDGIESLAYRLIPKARRRLQDRENREGSAQRRHGPGLRVRALLRRLPQQLPRPRLRRGVGRGAPLAGRELAHPRRLPALGLQLVRRLSSARRDRTRGADGEQLAFKASLIDEYNSQPEEDTSANSLTTLLGLSLTY